MPKLPETPFGRKSIAWRESASERNFLDVITRTKTLWQLRVLVGLGITVAIFIAGFNAGRQGLLPFVYLIPIAVVGGQLLAWLESILEKFASPHVCIGPKGLLWYRSRDARMYDRHKMMRAYVARFQREDREMIVLQLDTNDDGPVLFELPEDKVTGVIDAFDQLDLPCKDYRSRRGNTIVDLRPM